MIDLMGEFLMIFSSSEQVILLNVDIRARGGFSCPVLLTEFTSRSDSC